MESEDPDRPFVEAWRSGDNKAGHELFKRHFDDINGFIRRNVSDGSVEDLVQETFLQCQRSLANFAGRHTFRAYLYGIARNVLYDHLRKRHRRERLQDLLERTLEELGASPLLMMAERQEVVLFGHALRRIPLDMQVLFQLHFWEKLPAPALADIYDAPEGTIRSRIRRAKDLVRTKIVELASTPEELASTLSGFDTWAERVRQLDPRRLPD